MIKNEEDDHAKCDDPQRIALTPEEKRDLEVPAEKRTQGGRTVKIPKKISQDFVSR